MKNEKKLRRKQVKQQIRDIKANNTFKALQINQIVHRSNSELLAQTLESQTPSQPGFEPIVVTKAVVGPKQQRP